MDTNANFAQSVEASTCVSWKALSNSPYEDEIAAIWERALRRRSIDRDADFRSLGMSSNRAMQVIREIYHKTSIELPINAFYEAPTVRRMAAAIRDGNLLAAPDLVRLKEGRADAPVFLFGGGGGVMMELDDLVAALEFPGVIYGIPISGLDGIKPILETFEQEAARAVGIVRQAQPDGPYRLAGYSVGGLVALEAARILRNDADDKIFLGLLDTPQNDHAWPTTVWLRFLARKLSARLTNFAARRSMPRAQPKPTPGGQDINPPRRGTQYEYRFRNPNKPNYPYLSPYWVSYHSPKYSLVAEAVCRMKGRYMPTRYDGQVFFFASQGGDPLVCDPQDVWPRHLPNSEWIRLPGSHYSMMIGRNAVRLATEITQRIARVAPIPDCREQAGS